MRTCLPSYFSSIAKYLVRSLPSDKKLLFAISMILLPFCGIWLFLKLCQQSLENIGKIMLFIFAYTVLLRFFGIFGIGETPSLQLDKVFYYTREIPKK